MDTREPLKHAIANQIMRALFEGQGILPLQCLSESYAASVRKKVLDLKSVSTAIDYALFAYEIVPADPADLSLAIDLYHRHKLQFFDCLLLSTTSRVGCTVVISEDMQDGQTYGSVTVRNPFKLSAAELTTLLS